MSDDIIDLTRYLSQSEDEQGPGATFALWGAEGEKSRFALPLWRAIYLAGAERGGVIRLDGEDGEPVPFVVLDLAQDPPRTGFPLPDRCLREPDTRPGATIAAGQALCVYLGADPAGGAWFLVVAGREEGLREPRGRDKEDLLFLAGECAGLLFLRGFAGGEG